jgi:hypothetical protein
MPSWLSRHRRSAFLRLTDRGIAVLAAMTARAAEDHQAVLAVPEEVDLDRTPSDLHQLTRLIPAQLATARANETPRP